MDVQWITPQQAAERWGISLRYVQRLLAEGRVPNVKKYGRYWLIPPNAKKPNLLVGESSRKGSSVVPCFSFMWNGFPPGQNVDDTVGNIKNEGLRNQCMAEIAYLRGDFAQTKRLLEAGIEDEAMCICASLFSLLTAMSTNDFERYRRVEGLMKRRMEDGGDGYTGVLAEAVLATGAVGMFAPEMVPGWLKNGEFSHLPKEAASFTLYLRIKYLQNMADFSQMHAVAHTMLVLGKGRSLTRDVYLLLMCAVACSGIGQKERSREYVLEALSMGLPWGFITPFAENVSTLGGLVEECVKKEYPQYYDVLVTQWKETWKNWAIFHNRFARDHVPLILTMREYRIATLAATRVPYAQIAEREHISVGRVRNIMQDIYGKLFVCNRNELAELVLWLPKKT